MASCSSCHADLPADSRFCPGCGAPASAPVGATAGATATATGPPTPLPLPTPTPWHGRFEPGTRLGTRYRIVGLLGRGGMGEVYRADDLELNQPVALKFLPPRVHADAAELDRLRKEVRIARGISHPNVCRTYDISSQDGHVFVVMEYIDGEDLASVIRRLGRPSHDKAVEIARQICLGLGVAHDGGIIHRDLKPANIMIDGRGRVRITDFGLAGVAEDLSSDGTVSGTPAYMAPEQLAGGAASVQSDLYALGLVLYELFTGKRAYDSNDPVAIRRQQVDSSPRSPSSLVPDVGPPVERAIMRCLEVEPRQRPTSAYAVLGALPGGDPLAAALAAGETPSPELVANAGVEGSLRPAVAIACAVFALASFFWYAVADQPRYRNLDRSAADLSLRADGVLMKTGVPERPRFSYTGWMPNGVFDQDSSGLAARGFDADLLYWKRWSTGRVVHPSVHATVPGLFAPPDAQGDAMAILDPHGRLVALRASPESTRAADWRAFVEVAGYDASRMEPVAEDRSPSVKTDSVTAWRVPDPRADDRSITLVAGWLGGGIDYFSIDAPWGSSFDPRALEPSGGQSEAEQWASLILWAALPLITAVVFGLRNLRAGRGDRRGATRLAVFVFGAYMIGHFVVLNVPELGLRRTLSTMVNQTPLAHSLMHAISVWFMYIALEPYIRRLWPRVLVSWARLVSGRWRDPIIGRDILAGFVFAAVGVLSLMVGRTISAMAGQSGRFPLLNVTESLAGLGNMVSGLLYWAAISVLVVMAFFALLLIFRAVIGSNAAGIVGAIAVFGVLASLDTSLELGVITTVVTGVVLAVGVAFVGLRFGFLAALVGVFVRQVVLTIPWTTNVSAWYSDRVFLAVVILGALLAYGFLTALGGKSIFRELTPGAA